MSSEALEKRLRARVHSPAMPGWILQTHDETPRVVRITPGVMKTIGRGAQADFIFDAPLVSRLHCRLTADVSGQLVMEDLGSTNGTSVNGTPTARAVLRAGDVLGVGRVTFTVTED
ncbi:MAG: FHA domain-containing protein [Acidimicrobiia bacterium]|nr:FHA domain-containing protein [Acidimicrobiia bacterium]